MKHYLILIFLFFLIISCQQKKEKVIQTGRPYLVNSNLKKSNSDTLFISINALGSANFLRYLDNDDGFCKLTNDSIIIWNPSRIAYETKSILIYIYNGLFNIRVGASSCTDKLDGKIIEQRLVLNQKNYKLNDTIIGEVYVKSIFVLDSVKGVIDTTVVTGKFKYRIRDANFSRDIQRQERHFLSFLKLSSEKPEEVTSLNLCNSGLTQLPKELSLFKNLDTLELSDNDLSEDDLSILAGLINMKSITLDRCNLIEFPASILSFKKLKELSIWNNNIKKFPLEVFQLTSLERLELGGNELTSLPSELGNLKNLKMLSIQNTSIKRFPESILKLKKLKVIYPNDSMDYFPKELAKCLDRDNSYYGIKNINEFKNLIPKRELGDY